MPKVLIVDDEFPVRYAVRSVLEDAGYEVLEAQDGMQALGALSIHKVDVAMVDLIMPNKEGIETTLEIRRTHPSVRVIVISGGWRDSNFDFLELAKSNGAHGILRKPFTDEQLLAVIAGGDAD